MNERLESQGFLGVRSGERLRRCRLGIVGLGGSGSHVVQQAAHLGIGCYVLVDHDWAETRNMNRLIGATASDAASAMPKAEIARRLILGISPSADVVALQERWELSGTPLRGCDVIVGCVDSYAARAELESLARRFLIPYIDIGMDVTESSSGVGFVVSGQVILSCPGGPCLWCVGFLRESLLTREAEGYGAAGPRPQVVWPNGLLASSAIGLLVDLIVPWNGRRENAEYLEYDGTARTLQRSNRLSAVLGRGCAHYADELAVGDPFYRTAR